MRIADHTSTGRRQNIFRSRILGSIVVILAITIGLYPLTFIGSDPNSGLLGHKSRILLADPLWNIAFYMHIFFGGLALIVGWSSFPEKFRTKNIQLHRAIGKVYVTAVLLSALSGYYIALYATGGAMARWGFAGMSTAWLITTITAFLYIRRKKITKHQQWMIRSYAVTFTGVTFRLWLPLLIFAFDLPFLEAYPINAWISWVANILLAEYLIKTIFEKPVH